jgi:type IV pilus assembly protein PilC
MTAFVRLFRRRPSAGPCAVPQRPDGQRYPRHVEKKIRKSEWPGPHYFYGSQWRHDLLQVLEQIRLNVKSNVPLAPAFAAAAEDYLHVEKTWSPQRVARLCKITGLAVLLLLAAAGALVTAAEEGAESLPEFINPAIIGVWLFLTARGHQYKPVTVFAALQSRMEAGETLSEAMRRLPRFFPKDLVSFVQMGEDTGKPGVILDDFTKESIKMLTANREMNKVLWYIGLGIALQFGVISFLMVKVVPVFYEVLNELGVKSGGFTPSPELLIPLPPTNLLVVLMDALVYKGPLVLGVVVPVWFWLRKRRTRRSWSSRASSTLLLGIPGLRGLVARQNLASAAYMLRHLLVAGVPLERALDAVAHGDLHPLYRRCFSQVRKRVMNGDTLHDACEGLHLLAPMPRSFVAMLSMAETTGNLERALDYLAKQYYAEAERRRRLLSSFVLPAGVLLMGYIVLSMEMSIFKSMIALADAMIS